MSPEALTVALPEADSHERPIAPEEFSVVYFGNDWSAENRTSSHHIARILGDRFRLLYIETPGMRTPSATRRDLKKLGRKLLAAMRPPRKAGEHMWVMTVPQIPFRRWAFVRKLNERYGQFAVRRAIRRLHLQNTISWFAVPHPGTLAGRLGENYTVYYCIDDYSALPDVDSEEVRRRDDELTRIADQIFVASRTLLDGKCKINPKTEYSPHGVDFAHFSKASDPATPLAEAAQNLAHPVIGFFGSISGWIDIQLVAQLARSKPEWTFLLIGFASVETGVLRECSNVILAGTQPYGSLPQWAKAFDVAILPYRRMNQGAMNANPLKLREYLATGKPVVAVSTPEIERFSHCIRIANTPEEFLRQIENALTRDSNAEKSRRMEEVTASTWEARVENVIESVRAGMAAKVKR
jgi:glycosyltransferase involved in cell wall biosynthesis